MTVEIHVLTGDELEPHLNALARLRIEIFRAFPYLYDGDLEYEREYLANYAEAENCVFVLAIDDDEVVGASTAVRMDEAAPEFQTPFEGQDLTDILYFGESVLLHDYRGQRIGHRFFDEREKFAAGIGCTTCVFSAVEREDDHPARPEDYTPFDRFWHDCGYVRLDHLRTQYPWKDVGEMDESHKDMVFWAKALA